ncbi:helix-turn-helix domain-containing protein [Actinospongicola halichondriae]|uniref:helix-turn-helix domain-containing protein n=1 Tax=Actinospongicola halichondriae TaxID=3236844 RepID=UPI003D3BC2D0
MTASELIRRSRAWAGLSQRQLAERAGTSGPAISFYETGERVPRLDTLERIIGATGAELTVAVHLDGCRPDPKDTARRLRDVLDLAEALPQRHDPELRYPVLRDLLG